MRHNFETAHRLFLTPGKCENIHGHSWWCTLSMSGPVDERGMVVNFTDLKAAFRAFLDSSFDHRVLLYEKDPWSEFQLPGSQVLDVDPTTENLARLIGSDMVERAGVDHINRASIELWETSVNCATWIWSRESDS